MLFHPTEWLHTCHLSEPTFDPTKHRTKHSLVPLFYLFARLHLLSSSFLFSNSSHCCFSIFPYSRKFDFETSFDHLPIKRGNSISLYMEVLAGKASMHGACSSKPCLITGTYEELRMTQHLWVSIPEAIPAGSVSALFRRQRGLLVCTAFRGLKVNWHSCLGQVDSKQ